MPDNKKHRPAKKKEAPPTPAADPLPEWVTDTPDVDYELSVWSEHFAGGDVQHINVSREEYTALKLHLAKMRGYDVKEEKA